MRKVIYLLIITLFLPSTLWATDPIIGSWKLNVEKSDYSPILEAMRNISPPKEQISICRENDKDQIECTDTGVRMDGSPFSIKVLWPLKGGIGIGAPPFPPQMTYVETFIEPGKWNVTIMRNGIQAALMKKIISKDGKAMRIIIKGVNPEGKPFEHLEFYDRQ